MTDDNTTSDWAPGGKMSNGPTQPAGRAEQVDQPWDPDTDETEWWADDRVDSGSDDGRRPRRLVTIVGLLTVAGFGAATVISSGETPGPATTVPPTAVTQPSTTIDVDVVEAVDAGVPVTVLDAAMTDVSDLTVEGLSARPELNVVALSSDGTLHEIDFAAGTVRSTSTPGIDSTAPAYIFTRDDEISVISYDNVSGFVLDRNREPRLIEAATSAGGVLFPGPYDSSTWQLGRPGAADVAAELVALDGQPIGPVVRRDVDTVLGSDGLGQLVVAATGGTYVVGTGLPSRVTTGEVLAIGAGHALVRECDDRLVCEVLMRSRTADQVVTMNAVVDEVRQAESTGALGGLVSGTVSPDGTVAMVRSGTPPGVWSAVDLVTDSIIGMPSPAAFSPVVWSADSRFAVFVSTDGLLAFDRDAGRTTTVDGLGAVRSIAPRQSPRLASTSGSLFENGAVIDNGVVVDPVLADG